MPLFSTKGPGLPNRDGKFLFDNLLKDGDAEIQDGMIGLACC